MNKLRINSAGVLVTLNEKDSHCLKRIDGPYMVHYFGFESYYLGEFKRIDINSFGDVEYVIQNLNKVILRQVF